MEAWLGTAGTVTHLHTGGAENLLCQVCGYKLVCLFPPSVAKEVYCETRNGNGSVNQCACVWYFPNPGTGRLPPLPERLLASFTTTHHKRTVLPLTLVTVRRPMAGDCCPYIVQYIAIHNAPTPRPSPNTGLTFFA